MAVAKNMMDWALFAIFVLCSGLSAEAAVWYVDVETPAVSPTGTTWGTAFPRIQQGVDAAFADGGGEVWVAEGYYIENGILNMRNGVDVYGGFAGTETARSQRDWAARITTIDGATANDGAPVRHVVTGADGRIDGFTITGGQALGGKQAINGGGGLLIMDVSCTVANCTFFGNTGDYGGAVYVSQTPATVIERCSLSSNHATVSGGAVYVGNGGSGAITIRNSTITSNSAGENGGGLFLSTDDTQLLNGLVAYNQALTGRGGGVFLAESGADVINCTISQNTSGQEGAGIASMTFEFVPRVLNSIVWENYFQDQDSAIIDLVGPLQVRYSCIAGGYEGLGNIDEDPLFDFGETLLFSLTQESPCIDNGDPAGAPPAPATDINEVTRPQGVRVDMGAFEFPGGGEGEGEGEPFSATLVVQPIDANTEQNIMHAVVRVEPQGIVSGTSNNGTHFIGVQGPATCQLFITATGYNPASRTATVDTLVESLQVALTPNQNGSPDSDGDGLTDNDEITLFSTNPNTADSDGDGISDLFEVEFGLNPLLPNEDSDADGDRLTDLEEFLQRSDPTDPNDPRRVYFVSPQTGPEGNGTPAQPFRSIGAAIDALKNQVNANAPAALLLLPGIFEEDVDLEPGFELIDANPLQESAVEGTIKGAEHTVLTGISVYESDDKSGGAPLIQYDDGNARLRDLFVQGLEQSAATGLRFAGDAADTVSIRDCVLDGFASGVEVVNALPSILRTQVYNGQDGILLQAAGQGETGGNALGDATNANSGWNRFSGQAGKAVVNERPEAIRMENIDWDTDSAEQVANLIDGPADFEPFLAKGAGLLPSSITCVVWDAITRERITNASATITPGGYAPVTENIQGVYTFAAVPGAQYTVRIAAANYGTREQVVNIAPGASANLVFALGGEEFVIDDCGCGKSYASGAQRKETAAGNLVLALAVVSLSLSARFRRR